MADILVTIPAARLSAVEQEERDIFARVERGEKGWTFYWTLARAPRVVPQRIYFLWDGAVRAWHEVIDLVKPFEDVMAATEPPRDMERPAVLMKTEIHKIEPIPMRPFRGFRYFDEATERAKVAP